MPRTMSCGRDGPRARPVVRSDKNVARGWLSMEQRTARPAIRGEKSGRRNLHGHPGRRRNLRSALKRVCNTGAGLDAGWLCLQTNPGSQAGYPKRGGSSGRGYRSTGCSRNHVLEGMSHTRDLLLGPFSLACLMGGAVASWLEKLYR